MDKDELTDRIRTAYEIVRSTGIEEPELQREAFLYALSGLGTAGKSPGTVLAPAEPFRAAQPDDSSTYQKIAKALDMPLEAIELFFDLNSGSLALNLPTKALPDSNFAAMREIAVLLAVGRKHAGLGTSTSLEMIRAVCDDHGKLDKKNFAAAMTGMKPKLTVSGKGTERELIPKKPADDLAAEILGRYVQHVD